MNKISILLGFICLLLYSCASHEDEPDTAFKGPWRVVFHEEFIQLHNKSKDFNEWFTLHSDYLSAAKFLIKGENLETRWEYPTKNEVEYYYSVSYCGTIEWYMEITTANENDLKSIVKEFESFTIIENEDDKFDKFSAAYLPFKETP